MKKKLEQPTTEDDFTCNDFINQYKQRNKQKTKLYGKLNVLFKILF
jgi:hypothetical protein